MIKTYYYAIDKDDAWGKVNDLHPKSLFSFPIPEGMTYENEPIKFEIEI